MIENLKQYNITKYWHDLFSKASHAELPLYTEDIAHHVRAGYRSMAEELKEQLDEYERNLLT